MNGAAFKNMLIPMPPLAEQHRIVAKVGELMPLCDQLEEGIVTAEAEHLFNDPYNSLILWLRGLPD